MTRHNTTQQDTTWHDNKQHDTKKTRQDGKTRLDAKTRRYNNARTLLSMPMCTFIIVRFANLFEIWAGAQTIWTGKRMLWFRLALPAKVPAPMKIIRMNFNFAGFLWCHACAVLMPFNRFRFKNKIPNVRTQQRFQFYTVIRNSQYWEDCGLKCMNYICSV